MNGQARFVDKKKLKKLQNKLGHDKKVNGQAKEVIQDIDMDLERSKYYI